MIDFSEKLSNFIENVCPGNITDCEHCPGGHYKGFGCVHPDHPSVIKQTAPFEHCPDCGTRTGGGRCGTCKDLIQNESARKR